MMRRPSIITGIVALLGVFITVGTTRAEQGPLSATTQHQPPVGISTDSGSWRREPFIGSTKKSDAPPTTKNMLLKPSAKLLKPEREQGQEIRIQGIMQTDKAFHALINGRNVKAGDTIGGVTIKHISRYQVVVLNELKEKIIYDIYQGRIDRGKK